MINLALIYESLPALLHGTLITLKIAFLSCIIGLIGGTLLGIAQTSHNKWLKRIVSFYITIIRGTPMLFQIIIFVYIIPLPIPDIYAAILAIGINSAAYICEVISSGILSVSKGQREAAQILGLSPLQINRYIILPQAFRTILPALGNEFFTLIKDSSLASIVGVMELFKEGSIIISRHYDAISIYAIVGLIYLILTSTVSLMVSHVQKKLNYV